MEETDKTHWFLCGLGASFENFSTAIRASGTVFGFRDLLARVEGHEIFLKSINYDTTPSVAFSVGATPSSGSNGGRGRGGRSFRGGRGRGRRPPHCQLCHQNGHYANQCPQLHSFASPSPMRDVDLAKAFLAKCQVTPSGPDWLVDSGASDHMVSSTGSVSNFEPYGGDSSMQFGNSNTLRISSIGSSKIANGIHLRDVLLVPRLTKNLLSISKLTRDNPVDVLFFASSFFIQD